MRKGFLIMLAVVLVAALAAPAMAGTDINGFYRAKAWMSNFKDAGSIAGGNPTVGKDNPTNSLRRAAAPPEDSRQARRT